MDLASMDVTALKAVAYDLLVEQERGRASLNAVNQEIASRANGARPAPFATTEPATAPAAP